MNPKTVLKEPVLLAAIVAPFGCWLVVKYLGLDFWYDELYTLRHFVCVPLRETVTSYIAPNNHIFFSLISNVYLKLLGIATPYEAMDAAWRLRLLPLAATLGTLVYVYLIGRRHLDAAIARTSLLILVTTIPFFNFAVQFRGYSLSMCLLCALVYHLWRAESRASRVDEMLVVVTGALALYTTPLNLYFVLALLLISLATSVRRRLRRSLLLGSAIVVASVLHIPVWGELVSSSAVQSRGMFAVGTLTSVLPRTLLYFVSERWFLLPLVILPLFDRFRRAGADRALVDRTRWLLALLLIPFLLSFMRGDRPYERVFVSLCPIFALFVATQMHLLAGSIPSGSLRVRRVVAVLVFGYCQWTFASGLGGADEQARLDVLAGRKHQSLRRNYYQARYRPSELLATFSETPGAASVPLVCYYTGDEVAMRMYLDKFGLRYYRKDDLPKILRDRGGAWVVTAFPGKFEEAVSASFPGWRAHRLNDVPAFFNIFQLTTTSGDEAA